MNESDLELRQAIARLNARAWGIAGGLVCAITLFVATNVLVFQGAPEGQEVGPHLGLLSNFFPGYSVSFLGSIIGFVYAFVLGYVGGRGIGLVYNRLVSGPR